MNLCCLKVNNSVVVQGLSGGKEREVESRVGMCPKAAVLPDRTHVATYVLEFP